MNWAGARLPSFSVNALGGGLPGSVLEGVFDLGPCLFGVALELIDASLGAQAGVAGGAAEDLFGGALGPFELVGDLLTYAHCFLPMFVADSYLLGGHSSRLRTPPNELAPPNELGRRLLAFAAGAWCGRLSPPRPAT